MYPTMASANRIGGYSQGEGNDAPRNCNPFCNNVAVESKKRNLESRSQAPANPLVASEMGQLTPLERNKVYEDIHGVADIPEEDPEVTMKLLDDLKEEIRKIKERAAYNKAHFRAPSRVEDPKFLLMFLRDASFDVRLAAKKVIAHFRSKAALFGMDKVADPITFDDLDEDDKESVLSGAFQFLSGTDQSGRAVMFYHGRYINAKSWENYVSIEFVLRADPMFAPSS